MLKRDLFHFVYRFEVNVTPADVMLGSVRNKKAADRIAASTLWHRALLWFHCQSSQALCTGRSQARHLTTFFADDHTSVAVVSDGDAGQTKAGAADEWHPEAAIRFAVEAGTRPDTDRTCITRRPDALKTRSLEREVAGPRASRLGLRIRDYSIRGSLTHFPRQEFTTQSRIRNDTLPQKGGRKR